MRFIHRDTPGFGVHTAVDALLIASGFVLLLNIFPLPEIGLLYSLALAITGLLLISVPISLLRRVGFLALLLGAYLVFRLAGIISTEYLRYGFACFLLLVGVMGVVWDATQRSGDDNIEEEAESVT